MWGALASKRVTLSTAHRLCIRVASWRSGEELSTVSQAPHPRRYTPPSLLHQHPPLHSPTPSRCRCSSRPTQLLPNWQSVRQGPTTTHRHRVNWRSSDGKSKDARPLRASWRGGRRTGLPCAGFRKSTIIYWKTSTRWLRGAWRSLPTR